MNYQIVIPAYNAADSLDELTTRIRQTVPEVEILVIDDGSIDDTPNLLKRLEVKYVRHDHNRGKGEALKTGFAKTLKTTADAAVQMDADLQHEPESLPQFFERFGTGEFDVLIGTRDFNTGSMPLSRRLTNRVTSWAVSRMAQTLIPDAQSGYRLIGRRVLEATRVDSGHFDYESEFLIRAARAGFKIGTVPIRTIYQGEASFIRPWRDTARFIKLMGLFWRDWTRDRSA